MPWLEILVILALVLLNGYFAMSELAVVSARPARLEAQARKDGRGARLALALARDPGRVLSTVQIGITLVGIVAGAFGGARLAEPLWDALARVPALAPVSAEIAYTLVVTAITYLSRAQPFRGREGQPGRRARRGAVRSLLAACLAGQPLDLRAALRPVPVLPDSTPALRALEALRQARVSIARVVDEYGRSRAW
jgi:CBS domain containing-hemolysin-like protein